MQKPTRIIVFGVLCLLMGLLSGLKNGTEVATAIGGPALIAWMEKQPTVPAMQEMNEQSYRAMKAALDQPVYRIGLGVESAMSLLMAGLLCVAGLGLLMERRWSLRLTRIWSCYALVGAAVTVILEARYVLPQSTSATPGSEVLGVFCILPVFWVFPVLLLVMLGRPAVSDYLRWRSQQPRSAMPIAAPMPPGYPAQAPPTPQLPASAPTAGPEGVSPTQPPAPRAGVAPPSPADPPPNPRHETWRDDPWNDPSSQ